MKTVTSTTFILTDNEAKAISDTIGILVTMMNKLDITDVERLDTVCTALEAIQELWDSDFVDVEE